MATILRSVVKPSSFRKNNVVGNGETSSMSCDDENSKGNRSFFLRRSLNAVLSSASLGHENSSMFSSSHGADLGMTTPRTASWNAPMFQDFILEDSQSIRSSFNMSNNPNTNHLPDGKSQVVVVEEEGKHSIFASLTAATVAVFGSDRSFVKYFSSNNRRMSLLILVSLIFVGIGASAFFVSIGILSANKEYEARFERRASEFVRQIQSAFKDYEVAGLWVQEANRKRQLSRQDFRELYLNLLATGLEFQVTSFNPNISSVQERLELEQESRRFYSKNYPELVPDYQGIMGLEPMEDGSLAVTNRSLQPFYFPVHYLEPVEGNVAAIDFDLYSSPSRQQTIELALSTWKPALTPRLQLVQEMDPSAYSVILMHPGIPLKEYPTSHLYDDDATTTTTIGSNETQLELEKQKTRADSFSSIVLRIPDLLKRAAKGQEESASVYIFDTSNPDLEQQFLGGTMVHVTTLKNSSIDRTITSLPECTLHELQTLGGKEPTKQHLRGGGRGGGEGQESTHSLKVQNNQHQSQQRSVLSPNLILETPISIIESSSRHEWTIVVHAIDDMYQPNHFFVILSAACLFLLCVALGIFIHINMRRMNKLATVRSEAQQERALLIVENAQKAAHAERELNDFIAHEVRNPLAAAMSACSFVSSAIQQSVNDAHQYSAATTAAATTGTATKTKTTLPVANNGSLESLPSLFDAIQPLTSNNTGITQNGSSQTDDQETDHDTAAIAPLLKDFESVQEDIAIIDTSLHFINDLLRNMLDMQRASSKQLKIEMKPTHILHDIFEPVVSMLYSRAYNFEILLDCSNDKNQEEPSSTATANANEANTGSFEDVVVMTDSLRLKQVILNLTRNAMKFVDKGFIRLKVRVVDNPNHEGNFDKMVQLCVEDSGPGIPPEKRGQLFRKFQESLDTLNQGTGIGLCLCQQLTDLMGGKLWVDDTYDSGVESCPGTRFVIDMNLPPLQLDESELSTEMDDECANDARDTTATSSITNPRTLQRRQQQQQTRIDETKVNGISNCEVNHNSNISGSELADSENENSLYILSISNHKNDDASCTAHKMPLSPQVQQLAQPKPHHSSSSITASSMQSGGEEDELPNELSVLFVDDDLILRRLFARSIKRVAPNWNVQEASSGESALRLIDEARERRIKREEGASDNNNTDMNSTKQLLLNRRRATSSGSIGSSKLDLSGSSHHTGGYYYYGGKDEFDLIFIDQYMASVQKQLLGTETTQALRARGVQSVICGLSANDVETSFLRAGADSFLFKPFPCQPNQLRRELLRVLEVESTPRLSKPSEHNQPTTTTTKATTTTTT